MLSLDDRQILGAYLDENQIDVQPHYVNAFTPDSPTMDLTNHDDGLPIRWFGASSVYFNALVRTLKEDPFASVTAEVLNPGAPETDKEIITRFIAAERTDASGEVGQMPLYAFFGPKKRAVLLSDY